MAMPSSFLSEDQYMCSICLDFFSEPVSVPCGHNFCKACVTKHWENKKQRKCPLCNVKFNKELKLCVNTVLREMVENFKGQCATAEDAPLKTGEVPCDCCSGNMVKALKTCLVCLASYCSTHLEPHLRVALLKAHKLVDPVPNLLSKICKEHNRISELYCRKDQSRICTLCTEHQYHDTVPLEEEYEVTKLRMEQKRMEIQELIDQRQKKVQELSDIIDSKRIRFIETKIHTDHIFSTLTRSVQIGMCGMMMELGEKQRATDKQAEVLLKELEEELFVLRTNITRLESISKNDDYFKLIKSFSSYSSSYSPLLKNWSDVSISGHHHEDKVRRALKNLQEMLIKEMERASQEFGACCDKVLNEETDAEGGILADTRADVERLPRGIQLDAIRQRYEVHMTFDPCTANDLLLFSEDLKEAQTAHIVWTNDVPQKFNRYTYVLGNRSFSKGKFYYEVQVTRKTGWDLGVARESVRGQKVVTPNPRNGIWIIRMRNNRFSAINNATVGLPSRKLEKVGLFVDYDHELVSFYDVSAATLIYSFTNCKFIEKILPFFSPGLPEDGINSSPLVLTRTLKSSATNFRQQKSSLHVPRPTTRENNSDYLNQILIFLVIFTGIIWLFFH